MAGRYLIKVREGDDVQSFDRVLKPEYSYNEPWVEVDW